MSTKNHGKKLLEKVEREMDEFKESILSLNPGEIYEKAYEITTKEDIVAIINSISECPISNENLIKFYSEKPSVLDSVYASWLSTDANPVFEEILYLMQTKLEESKEE